MGARTFSGRLRDGCKTFFEAAAMGAKRFIKRAGWVRKTFLKGCAMGSKIPPKNCAMGVGLVSRTRGWVKLFFGKKVNTKKKSTTHFFGQQSTFFSPLHFRNS